jgi:redox-sensitive bicupin YhaK (pirin superfamily)
VALPASAEEAAPDFAHHGRETLPTIIGEGKEVRLITGSLYGDRSPVPTFTEMFYADA